RASGHTAGTVVALSNTIPNLGGITAGSSVVAFHLSANAIYGDGDDITSATTRTITSLAGLTSSATTTSVGVPATTPAGTYYVCARTDANGTVVESDELNNTRC